MSITVKNLRYVYNKGLPGETAALDDVSFEISNGSILGVIGHTGSGKSTLLQHLNGLLKPESGDVFIDDVCITDGKTKLTEIRRNVGLVFQYPEYQLFEETVAKDVAFGPRNLGLGEEEINKRVRFALETVGMDYEKIKNDSPFDHSGGNKRKIAIAGVLAMEPKVLILDEPTAGLDPKAHREILSMVRRIHVKTGNILIFVSHNMADIASMADKIIVMNSGRIVLEGTPAQVFSHSEELASMGLNVPPAREMTAELARLIPGFASDALSIEQAAEDIRNYIGSDK